MVKNDADVFRATRSLEGSARWNLARNDNSRAIRDLLPDFSCSVDRQLRIHEYPEVSLLLFRTIATGEKVVNLVKREYRRKRPFREQKGHLCMVLGEYRVSTYDYPSGHSTSGWLTGLVLGELWPDRRDQILTRARQYAESRVVCGVHNLSATLAAESLAKGLFERMKKSDSFLDDLQKAKAEIAKRASKADRPDASSCKAQSDSLAASGISVAPH